MCDSGNSVSDIVITDSGKTKPAVISPSFQNFRQIMWISTQIVIHS